MWGCDQEGSFNWLVVLKIHRDTRWLNNTVLAVGPLDPGNSKPSLTFSQLLFANLPATLQGVSVGYLGVLMFSGPSDRYPTASFCANNDTTQVVNGDLSPPTCIRVCSPSFIEGVPEFLVLLSLFPSVFSENYEDSKTMPCCHLPQTQTFFGGAHLVNYP